MAAFSVLPCIGSIDQMTRLPAAFTARIKPGRRSPTLSWPKRPIRVRRPGMLFGFRASISGSRSSAVMVGPHLTPMGLEMPRMNSMWAPSNWRVRSPIHSMWAEVSNHSPDAPSRRVRALSTFSSRASWLVKTSTRDRSGWVSGVTPTASMKARASVILSASSR
ncbi:hypothetical protein D3C77_457600 [compost metagenome]